MIASPAPGTTELALEPLIAAARADGPARGGLPAGLATRYGGDLSIPLRADRPTVVMNFVSTLDGVVSYATPEAAGGGEISGFFEPDRFVMGLLRALADVVLVGAGTVRAAPDEAWTPASVHPASAKQFDALRQRLGLAARPTTAVVTGSGEIDLAHPGLADPDADVVIITSDAGAERLHRQAVPAHLEIVNTGGSTSARQVSGAEVVAALARRGPRLVLCEGGPHLFGELLEARLVDELFLTIAPQIAGRSAAAPRLALVEGTAFGVTDARWSRLLDLRRAGDHLFARYRVTTNRAPSGATA